MMTCQPFSVLPNPSLRADVLAYVSEKYAVEAEYLWESAPDYAVLRNKENRKWFGIIMNISEEKLGLQGDRAVDIINVKCPPEVIFDSVDGNGLFHAYHMSKGHWISLLLDGTVPRETVFAFIDGSYRIIEEKKQRKIKYPASKSEVT